MDAASSEPLVSVAIPTFKRVELLRRAVESVLGQTYRNWELVVSDDEEGAGETWAYLGELARSEPRLRAIKNEGHNGQVPNTNNALLHARGEWIKLLHDDDLLKPSCLSDLVGIAEQYRDVPLACITCGLERYVDGSLRSPGRRAGWPIIELIPQDQIHVVMYMAEDAGGAAPSQKMIHRRVLERGVLMEQTDGLHVSVDSWFNACVGQCGDLLIYRKPLVEWHQGSHETETGRFDAGADEELFLLRDVLWELIADRSDLPPPLLMKQMVAVHRAVWRVRNGQLRTGLRLLKQVRSLMALVEYGRWVGHNVTKGRLSRGRRVQLEPNN